MPKDSAPEAAGRSSSSGWIGMRGNRYDGGGGEFFVGGGKTCHPENEMLKVVQKPVTAVAAGVARPTGD